MNIFSKNKREQFKDISSFRHENIILEDGSEVFYKWIRRVYLNRFFGQIADESCWKLYVIFEYLDENSQTLQKMKLEPPTLISNEINIDLPQKTKFQASELSNVFINHLEDKLDKNVLDLIQGRDVDAFDVDFYPGEEVDSDTDQSFGKTKFVLRHV